MDYGYEKDTVSIELEEYLSFNRKILTCSSLCWVPLESQLLIQEITLKIQNEWLVQFQTPTLIGCKIVPCDSFTDISKAWRVHLNYRNDFWMLLTPPKNELSNWKEKRDPNLWQDEQRRETGHTVHIQRPRLTGKTTRMSTSVSDEKIAVM